MHVPVAVAPLQHFGPRLEWHQTFILAEGVLLKQVKCSIKSNMRLQTARYCVARELKSESSSAIMITTSFSPRLPNILRILSIGADQTLYMHLLSLFAVQRFGNVGRSNAIFQDCRRYVELCARFSDRRLYVRHLLTMRWQ